jgi:hypothetical protein
MWDLHDRGKIQFTDAIMEDIPRHEQVCCRKHHGGDFLPVDLWRPVLEFQFCLAVKTDIMMGVHG